MFWAEIAPALAYGLAAAFIPESPRWLVGRGREGEARAVLERTEPGQVDALLTSIRRSLVGARPRLRDLRQPGRLLPAIVWTGIGLSVLQQLVGINVIFYYGTSLWRSVGFGEEHALLLNVLTGVVNIAVTFVAIACVDRFGRRPLLLAGSAAMTVCLGSLAVCFASAATAADGAMTLTGASAVVALVAANGFVVAFGASWGPVVWVLLGEMFSNRIRGAALALAAGLQWVANFAVSTTFPPLAEGVGLGVAYALYAGFAALSLWFVWRRVGETKGVALEAMGEDTARDRRTEAAH